MNYCLIVCIAACYKTTPVSNMILTLDCLFTMSQLYNQIFTSGSFLQRSHDLA